MTVPPPSAAVTASQRRFARNLRWQFAANVGQSLLGGAYLICLGRFLGPAEFGLFSGLTALVSVFGLVLDMRLQEVVARDYCHLDTAQPDASAGALPLVDLLVLETLSRLLPSLALLALARPLSDGFGLPVHSTSLVALTAAGFLLSKSGNSVSNGLLRVLGRTDLIVACTLADWGLRLLLSVWVAFSWHLDVSGALWIALLAGGACNAAQLVLASREYGRRVAPLRWTGWTVAGALQRLRSARRLILANLGISCSDLMGKDLDVALISGVLSLEKVGLYKMAKSFVQVIWRAIDPFYVAIMPEVQKLWQHGETAALARLLRKTSVRLLLLALALVVVGNGLVALFGAQVLGPGYAGVPELMLVMSVWVVICAPLIWGIPLAVAINRPELSVVGSVLSLLVGLAGFALLTPRLGVTGAGLAWNATLLTTFVVTTGLAVWAARVRTRRQS